ncbi:12175_t:CDS:2 [Entrophospora sp. SA101]|nr:20972_t:CDS:2 [Entrophospora sp. SA101]CAJ0916483.1 12175_t:CDS:2 [Entrophospora sp. SA101]
MNHRIKNYTISDFISSSSNSEVHTEGAVDIPFLSTCEGDFVKCQVTQALTNFMMPMKDYLEIVNQIYIYLAITSNLDFNRNERHDINAFFIGKHQETEESGDDDNGDSTNTKELSDDSLNKELLIGLDYNDLIKSYIVDFTTENVFIDAKLKKLRERYNTNEGDIIFEKYHSNYDNDNLLSFFNDNNNMEITTEESIAKWLIIEL